MFLNTNKFKQLLKRAYKGTGFTLGSIDGAGIFVHSDYWMIWFERSVMPNRTKAAIIEFSGTLPEDGEIFKVREGDPNQYEIDQRKAFDVRSQWKDAKNPLKRLPVILSHYQTDICLYQDKYGRISAADALDHGPDFGRDCTDAGTGSPLAAVVLLALCRGDLLQFWAAA